MKKIFMSVVCLMMVLAGSHAFAQKGAAGPAFKFKDGDVFDFGEVAEGPDVTHDFIFTNTGNAPLIVQDATPSCSCTTPEWDKNPVMPGQTGKIKVGFKTKDHPGPFTKEIYIRSNAVVPNGEKRYTIYIKGTVKPAAGGK